MINVGGNVLTIQGTDGKFVLFKPDKQLALLMTTFDGMIPKEINHVTFTATDTSPTPQPAISKQVSFIIIDEATYPSFTGFISQNLPTLGGYTGSQYTLPITRENFIGSDLNISISDPTVVNFDNYPIQ